MNNKLKILLTPLGSVLWNLMLIYVVYFVARVVYLFVNYSYFEQGLTFTHLMEMFGGGLMFDTSAILVTNIPYIVLMLFPLHYKETKAYHAVCRWVFLIVNGTALATNLCDSVYFRFTTRRTTTTVFSEFSNEGNLGAIFLKEAVNHWYLVLIFAVVIYALWKLYRPKNSSLFTLNSSLKWWQYDLATLLSLALLAPFVVAGIRGGFTTAVRPITISNANQYVNRPVEAALVLNTPFSLYRTIGKAVFVVPEYFSSEEEMTAIYNPIHNPKKENSSLFTLNSSLKKNVVVIIVESFAREYIGALNKTLEGGKYKGYTPNIDKLIGKSITFTRSYSNGRKSIDGMPSVLSSIPMFVEPFFLTPASMNHVSGIASLLAGEGYETAFFHGAQRGSMGFMAFARSTGFKNYYGREDYDNDKRFGGDDDFDGMWAIWDEPFLQYYATKMSEMKEPFMTAVFTASSHHPYVVPEKYKKVFPEEGMIMHKCIRYTDMALGKFFESASKQSWFNNTIFVLTSDHTNMSDHAEYQTDLGIFTAPIIIYVPGVTDKNPEMQDKIAQQIDILPTIMGLLNYQKPYFAIGIDVLNTPAEDTWAVNYLNGVYQYVKHGHVMQFDGQKVIGYYSLNDSLMKKNKLKEADKRMELELKAIIQQYMERMTQDRLHP